MAVMVAPKPKKKKKSVLKAIRQTARRTEVNRQSRGRLRAQLKKFRRALAAGNLEQARELLRPTLSLLDRSSGKGLLPPNTVARTKSRLVVRFNQLATQAASA